MARKNINYNSLILKAMHRPLVGEYVLYTRVSGANVEEGSTKAEQDEKYKRASQHTFNSPTNIRRIFITGKRVVVHLYTPFYMKGKPYTSYVIDTQYSSDSVGLTKNYGLTDMFDVIKHMMNERNELDEYRINKMRDPKTKEPTTYRVDGNILKVLSSTYACNNIEEIYFDFTALLAEELKPYVRQIAFENNYQQYLNSQSFSFNNGSFLLQALFAFNNITQQNLKNRFPRLRQIALVSNLENVIEHNAQQNHCEFIKNVKDTRTWYEVNEELIKASRSIVFMAYVTKPGERKPNTEFIVKDTQYKFDKEVLKDKVDQYKKQLDATVAHGKAGVLGNSADANNEDVGTLDEFNKKIIEIFENGDEQAKFVISIAAEGLSLSDRKTIADGVIEKYRGKQYRKLVSAYLGIK